jgi:hypothetical protein
MIKPLRYQRKPYRGGFVIVGIRAGGTEGRAVVWDHTKKTIKDLPLPKTPKAATKFFNLIRKRRVLVVIEGTEGKQEEAARQTLMIRDAAINKGFVVEMVEYNQWIDRLFLMEYRSLDKAGKVDLLRSYIRKKTGSDVRITRRSSIPMVLCVYGYKVFAGNPAWWASRMDNAFKGNIWENVEKITFNG